MTSGWQRDGAPTIAEGRLHAGQNEVLQCDESALSASLMRYGRSDWHELE
jgi:hypothetical protein